LITNWHPTQLDGHQLLELYRQRGTAEGHMGELMDVLVPALSSSPRTKGHYRGKRPKKRKAACDSFAHNEVRLLLNLYAYELCHTARVLLEGVTREGWSLRRMEERVLKIAGRFVVHGRRVVLIPAQSGAKWWALLFRRIALLRPVEAS
jgi:hypothetical protein